MCADTFTNMNEYFVYTQSLQANVKVAAFIMFGPFHSQLFKHTEHDILKHLTLRNRCSCRFVTQTTFKNNTNISA